MIIASLYPCPFDIQDRHEFNASILSGDQIFAYEEGKVTTVKNDGTSKFPERTLMLGFKELNITPDQVDLLKYDNVTTGNFPVLKDLGITGIPIENILPKYIYRFRAGGQFG